MLFSRVPLQYCVVGKAEEHSRLVRGVVTDLHPDMLNVASEVTRKKLRRVLVSAKYSILFIFKLRTLSHNIL